MKTYKYILAILVMLFSSQLFPQSLWLTNTVPFTGPNQRVGDVSFISADIGYMPLMTYTFLSFPSSAWEGNANIIQ